MPPTSARDNFMTTEPTDKGYFHWIAFVLAVAVLAAFTLLPKFAEPRGELIGKPAPEFSLPVIHNGGATDHISLNDLRGKAVILSFWASWCGPCKLEAPLLDQLSQRLGDRNVVVIGVNTSDRTSNALAFAKAQNLSFPIVTDADGDVADSFGVQNLPTVVVIDKDGVVTAIRTGLTDEGTLTSLALAAR